MEHFPEPVISHNFDEEELTDDEAESFVCGILEFALEDYVDETLREVMNLDVLCDHEPSIPESAGEERETWYAPRVLPAGIYIGADYKVDADTMSVVDSEDLDDACSVVSHCDTNDLKEVDEVAHDLAAEIVEMGKASAETLTFPDAHSLAPCTLPAGFRRRMAPRQLAPFEDPFPVDCLPTSGQVARASAPGSERVALAGLAEALRAKALLEAAPTEAAGASEAPKEGALTPAPPARPSTAGGFDGRRRTLGARSVIVVPVPTGVASSTEAALVPTPPPPRSQSRPQTAPAAPAAPAAPSTPRLARPSIARYTAAAASASPTTTASPPSAAATTTTPVVPQPPAAPLGSSGAPPRRHSKVPQDKESVKDVLLSSASMVEALLETKMLAGRVPAKQKMVATEPRAQSARPNYEKVEITPSRRMRPKPQHAKQLFADAAPVALAGPSAMDMDLGLTPLTDAFPRTTKPMGTGLLPSLTKVAKSGVAIPWSTKPNRMVAPQNLRIRSIDRAGVF